MLIEKYRNHLIIGVILILLSAFALWLRLIPMLSMGSIDPLTIVGSDDPLFNLRQVEVLIHNGLIYSWFDPMTGYIDRGILYWGPLFPTLVAACCIILGATTRPEIIPIALIVPTVLGALLVPTMYFIGRICGDYKTGLCAAGFTAIVSGQFFYRSFYGYMDHHIAEVLFSAVFCLMYMYILYSHDNDEPLNIKNIIILSVITGVAYLLGFFTMPTMILFAMIVGIFTVLQFILNKKLGKCLLIANTTIFTTVIIGFILIGVKKMSIDLSSYSVGHIYAYTGLIVATIVLYMLSKYSEKKGKYFFISSIIGLAAVFSVVFLIISPSMFIELIQASISFFGQSSLSNTIQEARAWSFMNAWSTFNYGLLLMFGGIAVLLYKNVKQYRAHEVFVLVWSLLIFYSTCQHIRYEYYLAINVVLLSAICVSFVIDKGYKDILLFISRVSPNPTLIPVPDPIPVKKRKKGKRKTPSNLRIASGINYGLIGIVMIMVVAGGLFVYTSGLQNYQISSAGAIRMNGDWKQSLEWMQNNTPDTGVDYYGNYQTQITYPSTAYAVMSWWDYGHMITYIAKRIPVANPFQNGVVGINGSAAFFISTDENVANAVLDNTSTRYVITDIEMDQGKFWAMTTWYNLTYPVLPYQTVMAAQNQNKGYDQVLLNGKDYYHTTISRLHNFDGSMVVPSIVYYVEHADSTITGMSLPVVTNAMQMDPFNATLRAEIYNTNAPVGYTAGVYSPMSVLPVDIVPALRYYRLVHESISNTMNDNVHDLKYVKIFEYVPDAPHIKGTGIMEIPIVTNTGRTFIYRQESVDGEFVIPYEMSNSSYDVHVNGKVRINSVEVNI